MGPKMHKKQTLSKRETNSWLKNVLKIINIFYSNVNEYYILSRICNVTCSEQSAILVQNYILPVFKSD